MCSFQSMPRSFVLRKYRNMYRLGFFNKKEEQYVAFFQKKSYSCYLTKIIISKLIQLVVPSTLFQ